MSEKKILFCRSGGGMPGLDVHAGIWRALEFAGIHSTHNHGTSAGAITAAFDSAGYSATFFCDFIRRLQDSDVRKERFAWKLRIPLINYFLSRDPIERIVYRYLPSDPARLEKPLAAWAMRASDQSAQNMLRLHGVTVRQAIIASMSIAQVFPPLTLAEGEDFYDGGYQKNLPLPLDWRDYDEVWLLVATAPPDSYRKNVGMLTGCFRGIGWLCTGQILDTIEEVSGDTRVKILWPRFGHPKGMLHFDHDLIDAAYSWTLDWLKKNYSR